MFLNDFDLDLGFLRGTPLTFGANKRKILLLKSYSLERRKR
jgi:hypothetical protein